MSESEAAGQVSNDAAIGAAPSVAPSLSELASLDDRDLAEHPDVYQRLHAELQSALAAIDDA